MQIDILTLFPKMFAGPFHESIVKRAVEKKLVTINIHCLRRFAIDERGTVDDRPFGGGPGMILRPEPIARALRDLKLKIKKTPRLRSVSFASQNEKLKIKKQNSKIILLSASGKPYTQEKARKLSRVAWLVLICGHYEGVDQRVADFLVDEEISIGDYILTGGELPAMVITDSLVRLIPGVLEKSATQSESFSSPLPPLTSHISLPNLEYPQYTRPQNFRGHKVPQVLLSGNHQKIENWRQQQALQRTKKLRPDLLTLQRANKSS